MCIFAHQTTFMSHYPIANAAVIYQSELDYLSRCILDYPDIETGGQLFGYWTSSGVPVIHYVIGPGENANHQTAFFNQDIQYLETVGGLLVKEFGLQHIGEWHSHHQLGLAHPSRYDAHTVYENMLRHRLRWFLLCIGNCTATTTTVNAFNFIRRTPHYQKAAWEVMPMESPFRKVVDQQLKGYLKHPNTSQPVLTGMRYRHQRGVSYPSGYWMNDKDNNVALKRMLDFVQNRYEPYRCGVSLDAFGLVHILVKDGVQNVLLDVLFPMGFPESFPVITDEVKGLCATGDGWNHNEGDIARSFVEYVNLHEI